MRKHPWELQKYPWELRGTFFIGKQALGGSKACFSKKDTKCALAGRVFPRIIDAVRNSFWDWYLGSLPLGRWGAYEAQVLAEV